MSVRTAEPSTPTSATRSPAPAASLAGRLTGGRFYVALGIGALVIAALSLLVPSTPSYDPWAWLVWGREIVHLKLHTTGGPTWKPLPVIFTTLFAPFGKAAPDLWLVVARAGAAMAVGMVFKLSFRLTRELADRAGSLAGWLGAPALAGLIAAVGLALSGGFISDNALGYSEGLLTAAVLIAVERHLEGKPRQAFAVAFVAALDRPEIWLFWGPYGLWLWWRDPGARKLVLGLFALIPVLWFLPEYWGSGHFFRGVNRAQHPRSNSSAFANCPFCSELKDHAWPTVLLRIKIATALAVAAGAAVLWRMRRASGQWRPETPRQRAMAAIILSGVLGAGWWVLIGIMTQAGFSGNNRYLVLGAALIEIAGAVGWGWAAIELGRALPRFRSQPLASYGAVGLAALVFLFVPNWVGGNLIKIPRTHRALVYQAHLRTDVSSMVRQLGGPARVLRCGSVMTEGFQVPMLAWTLGVHTVQVEAPPQSGGALPPPPNVIFQTRAQRNASLLPRVEDWPGVPYQVIAHNRTWRVYARCVSGATL